MDERITPCIDFGHLNARTLGGIASKADYAAILDKVEAALGGARAKGDKLFHRIRRAAAIDLRIRRAAKPRHWTWPNGTETIIRAPGHRRMPVRCNGSMGGGKKSRKR